MNSKMFELTQNEKPLENIKSQPMKKAMFRITICMNILGLQF